MLQLSKLILTLETSVIKCSFKKSSFCLPSFHASQAVDYALSICRVKVQSAKNSYFLIVSPFKLGLKSGPFFSFDTVQA